jgi:hypothetical protein
MKHTTSELTKYGTLAIAICYFFSDVNGRPKYTEVKKLFHQLKWTKLPSEFPLINHYSEHIMNPD